MSKFKHRKDCPVYGDYPKDDVPCGCKVMSEKLNIKDYPHHTHAAIIEVANTAIAKAYEAGQRNGMEMSAKIVRINQRNCSCLPKCDASGCIIKEIKS